MRRFLRSLKVRPHMVASIALGIATYVLLPSSMWSTTRAILAWNAGIFVYLVQIIVMTSRAKLSDIRRRAPLFDEGATAILIMSDIAALASIAAVVFELAVATNEGVYGPWRILLAILTLILSWTFVHVIFALHYAHDYYAGDDGPTLAFPGGKDPLYGDFFYFSFVIGCATATADINILSPGVRRMALMHGILSFVFNTTVLAMAINTAASLIGK